MCEPGVCGNNTPVQWLTVRRLPNRPITNIRAELYRPTVMGDGQLSGDSSEEPLNYHKPETASADTCWGTG
jgi:hypothetical protein